MKSILVKTPCTNSLWHQLPILVMSAFCPWQSREYVNLEGKCLIPLLNRQGHRSVDMSVEFKFPSTQNCLYVKVAYSDHLHFKVEILSCKRLKHKNDLICHSVLNIKRRDKEFVYFQKLQNTFIQHPITIVGCQSCSPISLGICRVQTYHHISLFFV